MTTMHEIRTIHSGYTGAPGYTQHYFDQTMTAQAASDAVHAFWEAVGAEFVQSWRYAIQADVNELDDSTGHLTSVVSTTPLTQSTFGSAGAYAAGVGACVSWVTGAVHRTKRLKGRTFLVPLAGSSYDVDGTIATISLNRIRAAAGVLAATTGFGVWGRPVSGLNGLWSEVLASNVKDQTSVLRSRRT